MRPVFEQPARPARGRVVEEVAVIGPEPRKERHVMGAHDRADRVDLQESGARKHLLQMPRTDAAGRPRLVEALSCERDAPRQGDGYVVFHREDASDYIAWNEHGGELFIADFNGHSNRLMSAENGHHPLGATPDLSALRGKDGLASPGALR